MGCVSSHAVSEGAANPATPTTAKSSKTSAVAAPPPALAPDAAPPAPVTAAPQVSAQDATPEVTSTAASSNEVALDAVPAASADISQASSETRRAESPEVVTGAGDISEEQEPITVQITIVGATGLRHSDDETSEPYCRVEITGVLESRTQTPAVKNGSRVEWNSPLEVENFAHDSVLLITVIDNSDKFKEHALGHVALANDQLRNGFEGELQLSETGGNIALIELKVSPTDPSLMQRVQATVAKAQYCAELAKEVVEEAAEEAAEAKDQIVELVEDRFNMDGDRGDVQIDGQSRSMFMCC